MLRRTIHLNTIEFELPASSRRTITIGQSSPRVNRSLEGSSSVTNQRQVSLRAVEVKDLHHDLESRGLSAHTEKGSKALADQECFVNLLRKAFAIAENGTATRPLLAGTAYQLCLLGLHLRSSSMRLKEINVFMQDNGNKFGLNNIEDSCSKHIAKHINATIAILDKDENLMKNFEEEPILDNFKAYVFDGLPVHDDIYGMCPNLRSFSLHIGLIAVAIHHMLGADFGTTLVGSLCTRVGLKGFGSIAAFDRAINGFYDKVYAFYNCRACHYDGALDYAIGTQRQRDAVPKSTSLASFLAWVEAHGTKSVDEPFVSEERLKAMVGRHLAVPLQSVESHTPPVKQKSDSQTGPATPPKPQAEATDKAALNDFYKKHQLDKDEKSTLWRELSKRKLTFKDQPFDEKAVSDVCADLGIELNKN